MPNRCGAADRGNGIITKRTGAVRKAQNDPKHISREHPIMCSLMCSWLCRDFARVISGFESMVRFGHRRFFLVCLLAPVCLWLLVAVKHCIQLLRVGHGNVFLLTGRRARQRNGRQRRTTCCELSVCLSCILNSGSSAIVFLYILIYSFENRGGLFCVHQYTLLMRSWPRR